MRFLLLIILIGIFSLQTYAIERPKWEDNCPVGLCDAVYTDIKWYWPDTTRATQEIYNYWAKRRVEFEKSLAECDLMANEFKPVCYDNLRLKQITDKEVFQAKEENKKVRDQIWKESNKANSWVMFNILPQ